MSKYSEMARRELGMRKAKIDDLVRDFGGVVTINGFHGYTEYDGKQIPIFAIAEDGGMTFWGGCKRMMGLAEQFMSTGDTLEEINATLRAEPFRVKFYPIISSHGKKFRPVDFLGEVEPETSAPQTQDGVIDDLDDETVTPVKSKDIPF